MTIAVDFDRVIHDIDGPRDPGHRMGQPIALAVESMQELHRRGHKLIIFTRWAGTPAGQRACENWLHYFKVPFHRVTALKPDANIYIDDKGYRFNTWGMTMEDLNKVDLEARR